MSDLEELAGHTLKTLRTALRKKQEELARDLGVVPSYVSGLENKEAVSREVFERAAQAMGAAPEAVDWTVDYLEKLEATARRPGPASPPGDEARRGRRKMAAEFGRRSGQMMLELLEWWDEQLVVTEEKRRAQFLLNRLGWKEPAARRTLVRASKEYHTWGLALLLCDQSLKAAADSADEAREQAELAVQVAELAPGEEKWQARVLGYCLAHLANAQRVKGDLKVADLTFARARRHWEKGEGAGAGLLNEARVPGLGASLRRDQRRFGEGLELIERALAVDRGEETPYLLINKSNLLRVQGELEAALAVLQAAEPVLRATGDSRLVLASHLNEVDQLSILGRYEEAHRKLPAVWQCAEEHAGEVDRVRLAWVQGRIAAGMGRGDEAMEALRQVRREFAQRRLAYDGALVALELAALHLRLDQRSAVKALADEMVSTFSSQDIHREALAALGLFCQVAAQDRATVALVERLVQYLHRARHNPELQFAPPTGGYAP